MFGWFNEIEYTNRCSDEMGRELYFTYAPWRAFRMAVTSAKNRMQLQSERGAGPYVLNDLKSSVLIDLQDNTHQRHRRRRDETRAWRVNVYLFWRDPSRSLQCADPRPWFRLKKEEKRREDKRREDRDGGRGQMMRIWGGGNEMKQDKIQWNYVTKQNRISRRKVRVKFR